MDDRLGTEQSFHVSTPFPVAAESCDQRMIMGQVLQAGLPGLNLCGMREPEIDHLTLQCLHVPVLLAGNAL